MTDNNNPPKKKRGLFGKMGISLVILGTGTGLYTLAETITGTTIAEGTRIGTLTTFDKRGKTPFSRSYEGTLKTGEETWNFSLDGSQRNTEDLARQLESYIGRPIRIKYHEVWQHLPWKTETKTYASRVELGTAEKKNE